MWLTTRKAATKLSKERRDGGYSIGVEVPGMLENGCCKNLGEPLSSLEIGKRGKKNPPCQEGTQRRGNEG